MFIIIILIDSSQFNHFNTRRKVYVKMWIVDSLSGTIDVPDKLAKDMLEVVGLQ